MDKSGFYGNAFFCEESQMTFMKHFFSNDIYIRTNVWFVFTKQQTITSLPHKRSIIKQNLYGCVPKHMKYISSYLLLILNSLNSLEMQVWREAGFSLGNNCNRCDHHLHTSSCKTEHRVGRVLMVITIIINTIIIIIIWPSRALWVSGTIITIINVLKILHINIIFTPLLANKHR